MAKKTQQEILINGLQKTGWKQVDNRSRYLAFENPQFDLRLFVGNRGALRAGKNATDSHSISEPPTNFYKKIFAAGQE
jgi:hypothetical protein